jgi:phage baseplate assembly protein W
MAAGEFHGRGFAFPLRVDGRGRIAEAAEERSIEASIRVILGTSDGERVMRPDFGCNLRALAFDPLDEQTRNLARYRVEEGLRRWEPRIEVMAVTVEPDPAAAALMIGVRYRISGTQDMRSLVYPFYLERG